MDGLKITQQSRTRSHAGAVVRFFSMIAAAFCARAADSPTLPDIYGRLPTLEDVILSPDGSKLAYVKTLGERRELMIVRVTHPLALGAAQVGDAKLRGIEWMDDERTFNVLSGSPAVPDVGGLATLFVPGLYVGDQT